MKLTGTIQRLGFGMGTWALATEAGTNYELYNGGPEALHQVGAKAEVEGDIRADVMTVAMIGPVLDVKRFKLLSDT